jgi:hypothetical protein
MEGKKYTFWQLLTNDGNINSVEIPIIQRDYVQGQENEKVNSIRKNILESIYLSLSEKNPPLDFDFVYGSLENDKFIPLDGQQRLTTLLLLHWYLSIRDGEFEKVNSSFGKFTYETRISSREFCQELAKHQVKLPSLENKLSDVVIDQPWFFTWWKKDPTIHAMLNMLDDIHIKFYNTKGLFGKLIDFMNPIISFQFIEIEKFGLSDKLYIRMNARGKELTEFEHFKARFEQFVEKRHPKHKAEFAKKIDGSWTEFFWIYKENDLIDEPFVRFFRFITEMLYHSQNMFDASEVEKISKLDLEALEKVYGVENNLKFLYSSLDLLTRINSTGDFFATIFTKSGYEKGKVALFDDSIDLFLKCKTGIGFEQKEKILFFFILNYMIINQKDEVDQDLSDRIRVVRNLVLRARQRKNTDFLPDLRYVDLHERLKDLTFLLNGMIDVYSMLGSGIKMYSFGDALKSEIEKAALITDDQVLKESIHTLEDNTYLKGAIHNLNIEKNKSRLPDFALSVNDIWPVNMETEYNNLVVRAILSEGFYAINIGDCALGARLYFGNSSKWHTILTMTGDNSKLINEVLPKFLECFSQTSGQDSASRLEFIIGKYLASNPTKDWRYYFIKYPEMLSENNLFAWKGDFTARHLNRTTLLGYHINPYVRSVVTKINDVNICDVHECYGQYDHLSPITLKNKVKLFSEQEGWRIILPEGFTLTKDVIANMNLEASAGNDEYWLKINTKQDRIAMAVDFIHKLVG